jgi:hypothetical protein
VDVNTQSGLMVGGNRETAFTVCQTTPCGATNPFNQDATFQIRPGDPAALIVSAGYKSSPRLDVVYGASSSLGLDLTGFDRFRVNFDGSDLVLNFNIVVFTPTGWRQTGCNLDPILNPLSIDFPFADFTGPGASEFTSLSGIDFIFQSGSAVGANDFAVRSFEAVPSGAPPAQITCHGLGT